ncbi:MAG: hypothetical protein RSB67_03960 [Clostridia bacterium]
MGNAQKAIMIGVGLFITIIIIAAVMLIAGMGQDIINTSNKEVSNISSNLQAQLTVNFDNKTMTGAEVIAAVKTYYMYNDLAVAVQKKMDHPVGDGAIYWPGEFNYYSKKRATSQESFIEKCGSLYDNKDQIKIFKLTDKSNKETYVRPNEKFIAKLFKMNNIVLGIAFIRTEYLK